MLETLFGWVCLAFVGVWIFLCIGCLIGGFFDWLTSNPKPAYKIETTTTVKKL